MQTIDLVENNHYLIEPEIGDSGEYNVVYVFQGVNGGELEFRNVATGELHYEPLEDTCRVEPV